MRMMMMMMIGPPRSRETNLRKQEDSTTLAFVNRVTNDPQTSFSRFIFQVDPSINHPPIQVHYWVYCMIHNKHTQQTTPFRHFVGDATDG